jgi:DNA recombination protein RmuC
MHNPKAYIWRRGKRMPIVEIALGACIIIAGFLGILFGRWWGAGPLGAEIKAQLDTITALNADKARLDELNAAQARENQQLREQVARAEEREIAQEQKYTQMKADVDKAFADLASKALRENNESFLNLAKQKLGAQAQEAEQTLAQKEEAIKNLIGPLGETLVKLDEQTRAMEAQRSGAYAKVETLVGTMQQTIPASLDALKNETSQLIAALRSPKTRGNWGELQLRRCVEYAGMIEHCSFAEQVSARDEDDRLLRPDLTIQLPNGREIVVDAKTPLDAFLDAAGSADPAAQKLRFEAHAQRVRTHLKDLSGKAYWKQFEKAPDFVVCFLPSEALFSAALEADPSLIEFGAQSHVVMATPTTLIALLRAVEFGWQQTDITKHAKAIHDLGRRIYEKLVVAQGHVVKLGSALANSVETYNRFLGSIEGKQGGSVFFLGRQLGDLVHSNEQLAEVPKVQPEIRVLESPEWTESNFAKNAAEEPSLALAASADDNGQTES